MSPQAEGRVRFDFDGALALARQLWALSGTVGETESARASAAQIALQQWQGVFAQDFAQRMNIANQGAGTLQQALQGLAQGLAWAWSQAADEQHMRDRAAEIDRIKSNRNWAEDAWDWTVGDDIDKKTPMPPNVEIPKPPSFEPTCNMNVAWSSQ
jgi:hypothetical protein